MMLSWKQFLENILNAQPNDNGLGDRMIASKYQNALNLLQNSRWFKGKPLPNQISLSKPQVQEIFGQNLVGLLNLNIVSRLPNDGQGGMGASYTVQNPLQNLNQMADQNPNQPRQTQTTNQFPNQGNQNTNQ